MLRVWLSNPSGRVTVGVLRNMEMKLENTREKLVLPAFARRGRTRKR
jgi:hypothetical protein